jgi:hypothetical protein
MSVSGTMTNLLYDSGVFANGQQRNLILNNEVDPYDKRVSIHSGAIGRRVFIDGNGNLYQSGHKTRIDIVTRAYNSKLSLYLTFNPTLHAISFRLRSRRKELAVPDDTNRFGGYVATLYRDKIEWRKENFKNNYTNLSPATSTTYFTSYNIENYKPIEVNVILFENLELGDDHVMKMGIDKFDGHGMRTAGKAVDTTPATHIKDKILYHELSYTSITVLGNSAQPYDVKMSNIQIFDIGDAITPHV